MKIFYTVCVFFSLLPACHPVALTAMLRSAPESPEKRPRILYKLNSNTYMAIDCVCLYISACRELCKIKSDFCRMRAVYTIISDVVER